MGWSDKANRVLEKCTSTAAFGDWLWHEPLDVTRYSFKGIWSELYQSVDPETGMLVMSSDPNVGVRLATMEHQPKKKDRIYRGEVEYEIRSVEPDGEGGATLVLEKRKCP